jgi:hypothetical protein
LIFNPRHLKKGQAIPWKKLSFFKSHFSCEWSRQPTFKFDIDSEIIFI